MGRVSIFADAEVIHMAREDFIPVACDDWYMRRKQDAEGEFFRKVADQGPRKGIGGATRQGLYMFMADGKLLAWRNQNDGQIIRQILKKALSDFKRYPLPTRKPGAIEVGELIQVDPAYHRSLPPRGANISVFTRILDHDDKDELCRGSCAFLGGDQSARDHLWLTNDEVRALVPGNPRPGDAVPLPGSLLFRLLRFHLVDNTRGEPLFWGMKDVRKQTLALTVTDVTPQAVVLQLKGNVLLASGTDPATAKIGFEADLLGTLRLNRDQLTLAQFAVIAVGEHWGHGPFTPNPRPGRTPLGISFTLTNGTSGLDLVPPEGAREWARYLNADRE